MRGIVTATVATMALVVLSACGGDEPAPPPQIPDGSTATSEPAPEWSATEPPPEPTDQSPTEESADEFGQFILATAFYSYATGDAAPLVSRGDAVACTGCASLQRFQDAANRIYQIPDAEPTFRLTENIIEGDYHNLRYEMDIPSGQRVPEGDPEAATELPASEGVGATVNIRWDNDHWTLLNFALGK